MLTGCIHHLNVGTAGNRNIVADGHDLTGFDANGSFFYDGAITGVDGGVDDVDGIGLGFSGQHGFLSSQRNRESEQRSE